MRHLLAVALAVGTVLTLAGCSSTSGASATPARSAPVVSSAPATPAPANATPTAAAAGPIIHAMDNSWVPTTVTVKVGTTVSWTKGSGSNPHAVKWADDAAGSETLTSTPYTRTFDKAGTYPYVCAVHGTAMAGVITVEP